MSYIDIHSHLAWDVDDGIQSKNDAQIAIQDAKQDGIVKIIITPHLVPGLQREQDLIRINERIEALRAFAADEGIDVYKGCEFFLNDQYLELLDKKCFNTLADSNYLLCEFDVRKDITQNKQAEEMLYECSIRNLIPVIAHAERYFPKGIDLQRVKRWKELGYVIQVNRTSLLGMHGSQIKKNAWALLKSGNAHVIASDAHQVKGNRICKLSDTYEQVADKMGEAQAQLLFYRNPLHIISNERIEELEIKDKKYSFLRCLKRRK